MCKVMWLIDCNRNRMRVTLGAYPLSAIEKNRYLAPLIHKKIGKFWTENNTFQNVLLLILLIRC